MSTIIGRIVTLGKKEEVLFTFKNMYAVRAAIINNAPKHRYGYLVNSYILDYLYQYKVIEHLKEDSVGELEILDKIISLIETRPFTTFLYEEVDLIEYEFT